MDVFSIIFLFFLPLLLIITSFIRNDKVREQKLPPGPWKLPIIGNLHQLGLSSSKLPHAALKELADKYGPLMHLKLGERSTIIISSYKILQEAVKTSDLALAGRPEFLVAKTVAYNSSDIAFAPYGDYWNQMRKICTFELLSPKRIHQSTYPLIEDEILRLITSIKRSGAAPVNLSEGFYALTCAIICRASVGKACKDPESLILAMKEAVVLSGGLNISDLFPSLDCIFQYITGTKQKVMELHQRVDHLLEEIVLEHEEAIVETSNGIGDEDLLHLLLRLKESDNFQIRITRDNIKATILDMFIGGTESSATLLEWAMCELMKNPRIMKKVQAEIREALKGKQTVDHSDIKNLKYLKCIVKETMRLHPPGPLSFPRESREECEINGYIIPNKTIALVNFWAMGRDPQYWRDPQKFDPDRFYLDECKGSVPPEFFGFGFGRRVCPGMAFTGSVSELALANLLYHFHWKLPHTFYPNQELDMVENFGTVASRKNSLHLIALPYNYPT